MTTKPALAPIVLFVYNRYEHTRLTIEALQRNVLAAESELFIFADGPKDEGDRAAIDAVRTYVREIGGFKRVVITEQEENLGLAASIISGVSRVVGEYGKIIVLEDDLVTSPYFLSFMNETLSLYEGEDGVASVSGYMFPADYAEEELLFLPIIGSWGWGTWREAWKLFEPDGRMLLEEIGHGGLRRAFDLDGTYPFYKMLERQVRGKNNSWAIRWYASLFLKQKHSIWPSRSLVTNIGFDGSGTHCRVSAHAQTDGTEGGPFPVRRRSVDTDLRQLEPVKAYFRSRRGPKAFFKKIAAYMFR